MKRPFFLLCPLSLSIFWAAGILLAQPLEWLGLKEALDKAEQNALVREEFAEASSFYAQREREKWRRLYLPSITVQRVQRSGDLTGQEREHTNELSVNYPLYVGGRDRASHRVAQLAGSSNRFNQQDVLAELKLMTAEAYLRLASSLQRVKSLQFAVAASERELDRAERRSQLGLRAKLEVLQSGVALADQRLELEDEFQRRKELALQLAHLVREEVTVQTEIEIEEGVGSAPRPLAYYLDWAESNHPALLRAGEERKTALEEAALQRAVRYPEISLTAGITDSEGETENRSLALTVTYRFGGHRAVVEQTSLKATTEQRFFQASTGDEVVESTIVQQRDINTTLFGVTFFDLQEPAASAESALIQARLNLVRAGRTLVEAQEAKAREIGQRLGDFRAALRSHQVANLRVEKNEAELRAYRRAFKAGTVRFEEFLEKQTAASTGRLERITTLVEIKLARVKLRSAAGLPPVEP